MFLILFKHYYNTFILIILISGVVDISICDWVEIPQVTTKYREQNYHRYSSTQTSTASPIQNSYRHFTTTGTSFQNYKKNSYRDGNNDFFITPNIQNGDHSNLYVPSTQLGRPEVTTERWSETTMSLEDLVNDALYNLKNPIVTTTTTTTRTDESSRIMMLTTTQVPPSSAPTIPTTRKEETGFDDLEENENEYYDDEETYVTTGIDDADDDELPLSSNDHNTVHSTTSSSTGDFNINKILSTIVNDKVQPATVDVTNKRTYTGKTKMKTGKDKNKSSLFSMAGFLPLLKNIQETLTKNNEKQTTSSKVELLQNIRDQLLENINYRMNKLWGDGDRRRSSSGTNSIMTRERRDARTFKNKEHEEHDHDHHYEEHEYEHHIDFPSNAAALLALSFLTFAVFLIKLVLQVIQALQVKAQNMTTTTTSATIIRLRRSEDEEYENAAKILNYIDTYSLK